MGYEVLAHQRPGLRVHLLKSNVEDTIEGPGWEGSASRLNCKRRDQNLEIFIREQGIGVGSWRVVMEYPSHMVLREGGGADPSQDRQTRSPREVVETRGMDDRPTVPSGWFQSRSISACVVDAVENFSECSVTAEVLLTDNIGTSL